jgi:hypothetical protein
MYINAGSNRWAVKPAIGGILPLRPKLGLEFEFGAWSFQTTLSTLVPFASRIP